MEIFALTSAILILYASIIAFYIAFMLRKLKRNTSFLAILFGVILITHSIYHFWSAVGEEVLSTVFAFISAITAAIFAMIYPILRK